MTVELDPFDLDAAGNTAIDEVLNEEKGAPA